MKKIKQVFAGTGAFLVDLLKLDQPGKGKPEFVQELTALSMGSREAVRAYYIRKISILLAVLITGLFLSVVSLLVYQADGAGKVLQTLVRPGYGEGDRKEALTVQIEGKAEEQQIEVTVQERKYTDEEKQELLDHALGELETLICGENESLDEVRSDLYFPEQLEEGAVSISWLTSPYGIISDSGSLLEPEDEEGVLVEIRATLTCSGLEASYMAYARVYPPRLSDEEQLLKDIRREVELSDEENSHEESLMLPESVDGRKLVWAKMSENPFSAVLALTLILAVCICLEMDSRIHQKAEDRKKQLMLDYPDLMWRMTMLLGAGLSIKGTFVRISGEYLREREEGQESRFEKSRRRYVYEEVTCACNEMNSGIPEAQAYERFGKRCQLPEYIRLGSVLSQNLKKGAKGLTTLLEEEAETSLNDRKNHARKIGEQAGTKLLLPMVLMLGIVLVILMVPAFLSF